MQFRVLNLEIGFKDEKLRKLCEDGTLARRRIGDVCARKLHSRLADLAAAGVVAELVAGRPHPLKHNRAGQFAVDLAGGVRLVFAPATEPVPQTRDSSIDWLKVTAVRIEFIGDYHD